MELLSSISPPEFAAAARTWARIAALSFGGPAGQIAVMHRILVDEKKWIREERFLHALNYCMLLPGPEAQQLATYIGWLLHGTRGGLVAGTLFILPGFLAILALSVVYVEFRETQFVAALLFGLKPAVAAIVCEAVHRIGQRVLKNRALIAVAALSFVALFFFNIPFPAIILTAAIIGISASRAGLAGFARGAVQPPSETAAPPSFTGDRELHAGRKLAWRAARISAVCLPLWFGPLVILALILGPQSIWVTEGLFFSHTAVITFGGAYSVLAYVAQQAVERYGWLRPAEMLDGLGMAETTPGPLIMVVQFVGFLGAYRDPGPFSPLVAGTLGAVVTTWVTFVPCFYWIFLGAPFVELLRGIRWWSAALTAITAAVVGVVLNLAVWFLLHTLFGEVDEQWRWGVRWFIPRWETVDGAACVVAVVAAALLLYWKRGLAVTLGVSAALGGVWHWLFRGV